MATHSDRAYWRILPCAALLLAWVVPDYAQSPQAAPCAVLGVVQSGSVPLPGVAITASAADGRELASSSTEQNGSYTLRLTAAGTYIIRATLAAFALESREVTLGAADCTARQDFSLVLASRAQRATAANQPPTGATALPSRPNAPGQATPPATAANGGRGGRDTASAAGRGRGGFQQLDVVSNAGADSATAGTDVGEATLRSELQLPPGFSVDAPTETFTASANQQAQSNEMLLFGGRGERMGEFGEGGPEGLGRGGPGGEQAGFGGAGGAGGLGGGRGGGPGGGFGGPGGPPGLGGMRGGGRLQGNANYNLGGSFFDSAPYPLNGRVSEQPDYTQQRYGSSIGGPLTIPHVFNGGTRTSFFLNYGGNNSRTPVDDYSTVPTLAARAGDLSASNAVIIDPTTGQPFAGNRIPASQIDPAAQSLLAYIPQPNLPGDTQNFHYSTATSSSSNDVNFA